MIIRIFIAVMVCQLAACGGGGGGGDAPAPATRAVSGRVSFDKVPFSSATSGLDYNAIVDAPVRGAVVEAIATTDRSTILASTTTDASGNYSVTFQSGVGFFVRAKAQMLKTGAPSWNFRVLNNTNGSALYVMDSADFTNDGAVRNLRAVSGWNGSSYNATRVAAPFAVLDAVYDAFNLVLSANANAVFPALDLYWSPNNINSGAAQNGGPEVGNIGTTSFHPGAGGGFSAGIYILGTANVDTDEYDAHVITHEWGHYFQSAFSRDDSIGGEHGAGDRLDLRVAFSEGWGNAFSAMAEGDSRYRDSSGPQQGGGFFVDMEQNPSDTGRGWYRENSTQSILYDLFDTAMDSVDAVSLGFAPLYEVMSGEVKTTPALTGIFPFIAALKIRRPDAASNIDILLNNQNIRSVDIDAFGSTETNNGAAAANLPIYRNIAIGGAAVNVCSSTANGEYNKLGNRRFLRFDVATSQQATARIAGPIGTDPDMVLFKNGATVRADADSAANGVETLTRTLTAGSYVLEVYDAFATDSTVTAAGNTCIDVTLTSP